MAAAVAARLQRGRRVAGAALRGAGFQGRGGRTAAAASPGPESSARNVLLTAADAFARELADPAVAAKFLAYELPADFVADLADDIAAIRSADADMQSDDQTGVASTAAVGRLIREGMAEVMQLDAIMNNKYARNPDRMRAWDSASHIDRAPRRAKQPAGGTPPASTKAAG